MIINKVTYILIGIVLTVIFFWYLSTKVSGNEIIRGKSAKSAINLPLPGGATNYLQRVSTGMNYDIPSSSITLSSVVISGLYVGNPSSYTMQGNAVDISTVATGIQSLRDATVNASSYTMQGNLVTISTVATGVQDLRDAKINSSSYTLQGNVVTISTVGTGIQDLRDAKVNPSSYTMQGNLVNISTTAAGVQSLRDATVNASSYTLQGNLLSISTIGTGVQSLRDATVNASSYTLQGNLISISTNSGGLNDHIFNHLNNTFSAGVVFATAANANQFIFQQSGNIFSTNTNSGQFLYNTQNVIRSTHIFSLFPLQEGASNYLQRVSTGMLYVISGSTFIIENSSLTIKGSTSGITLEGNSLSIGGINYKWPTADGSSGNVLETNGSGNLTWSVDDTGGGGGLPLPQGASNYLQRVSTGMLYSINGSTFIIENGSITVKALAVNGTNITGGINLPLPEGATNYLQRVSTGMLYNIPSSTITVSSVTATYVSISSAIVFSSNGYRTQLAAAWEFIAATRSSVSVATLSVTIATGAVSLRVSIYVGGSAVASEPIIVFNNDISSTYTIRINRDGTFINRINISSIAFFSVVSTNAKSLDFTVKGVEIGKIKAIKGSAFIINSDGNTIVASECYAIYRKTSQTIWKISLMLSQVYRNRLMSPDSYMTVEQSRY